MARIGDLRVEDENGNVHIAPTQRADGSWRPQIRVKKGYIPQEEIGVWKSRAQLAREREEQYGVPGSFGGESQVIMGSMKRLGNVTMAKQHPKPKEKKPEPVAEVVKEPEPVVEPKVEPKVEPAVPKTLEEMTIEELQKAEKRLRKKLRQIAALEEKERDGAQLEEEQYQKLKTKGTVEAELDRVLKEVEKRN